MRGLLIFVPCSYAFSPVKTGIGKHAVLDRRPILNLAKSPDESGNNIFSNIFSRVDAMTAPTPVKKDLSDEEKREMRRKQLDDGEIRRQVRVREDAIPYIALLCLQFLPLVGSSKEITLAYFMGVASITVFVAARQEVSLAFVLNFRSRQSMPFVSNSLDIAPVHTLLQTDY